MTMFKLSGKGQRKPFCINETCENFLPEDKRGYRRRAKKTEDDAAKAETQTKDEEKA
jgi:DNA topoisomerase-1